LCEREDDLILRRSRAEELRGAGYAKEMADIEVMRLYGQMVFNHSAGAKGTKLYNNVYNSCVAEEKKVAEREAKRAAREAAKAAQ